MLVSSFTGLLQMQQTGKRDFEISGIVASANHQIAHKRPTPRVGSGGRMCKRYVGLDFRLPPALLAAETMSVMAT